MSLIYIGAFPPEWGGVTVKNQDLYYELMRRGKPIHKIDLNRIKRIRSSGRKASKLSALKEAWRLAKALLSRDHQLIVGISAASRRSFTRLLYHINPKIMGRSIMILMGGMAAEELANDPDYRHCMSRFKQVYVETGSMYRQLKACGMHNVSVYPNCRRRPEEMPGPAEKRPSACGRLLCVFFSSVQKAKGVDLILESASELSDVDFSFYGPVDNAYRDEFHQKVSRLENCTYKGVFKGKDADKYRELAGYDVLLLPTRWITEGVPGILVEAKIAGLASIVSNVSFNSEIIKNGIEGIVLPHNNTESLTRAITSLRDDRFLLEEQKRESAQSADYYYLEPYVDKILEMLRV